MADREKAIKGLETCIKHIDRECPIFCPYYEVCTKYDGRIVLQPLLRDAFVLLRERPEVIRCKDCEYRHDSLRCQMYSEGMDTPDDWYCADGK